MWGHMAGISNIGDWSDGHSELPCGIMDSLDEIGTPVGALDAPLSNGNGFPLVPFFQSSL